MKSLFAIAVFSLALSLCNLTDRLTKGDRNTNNANNGNANTVANVNNANNQNNANTDNTNENENSNDNANGNSNLAANGNGNFGDEEDDTDGVEEGEVQAALMGIKRRWTQAIMGNDKATCRDVLADGFVNTDPRGAVTNREQFCGGIAPQNSVDAYTITDARLANQSGESATMTYVITFTRRGKRVQRWRDTDTFTKRDGRWKIISSASSPAG